MAIRVGYEPSEPSGEQAGYLAQLEHRAEASAQLAQGCWSEQNLCLAHLACSSLLEIPGVLYCQGTRPWRNVNVARPGQQRAQHPSRTWGKVHGSWCVYCVDRWGTMAWAIGYKQPTKMTSAWPEARAPDNTSLSKARSAEPA